MSRPNSRAVRVGLMWQCKINNKTFVESYASRVWKLSPYYENEKKVTPRYALWSARKVHAPLGPFKSPRRYAYLSGIVFLCFETWGFWSDRLQESFPTFQYAHTGKPERAWSISCHGDKRKSKASFWGSQETIPRMVSLPCNEKGQLSKNPVILVQFWFSASYRYVHEQECREVKPRVSP